MNLKQLAQELGLSQTTVSRALNGYPEVAEATRLRVVEAARRLHYRPNTRARSLATGRTMAIGHVIPLSTKHEMLNPIFADFVAGAGETYHRAGYDMILSIVSDGDEERAYRELASTRMVDGVIVHAPKTDEPRIPLLAEIGLPFVVHGRSSKATAPYSWLDVNNRRSFQRAAGFLADLGHRRIALVNGIETMDFAARRREGFLRGLADSGLAPDPALMTSDEMTEGYGYRAARRMLALPDPPTAFVVASIITAFGVRRAVEGAGLRLGRDVSIITHDDDLSYLRNGEDIPIFTALRSSVREAGRRAAEILLETIDNPGHAPITELLEAEFLIGESTGPAPGPTPALVAQKQMADR
ncbi:LacI family DNA-binding transcriptional regulator [Palleronia sp. KMU-117]|uniref:LacI family DNA-binding transcriptional regulator n=1 Tax=Palleronia sp. KMU-117 TaxID=3434108 RepID=UPI003D73FC02